MTTDDIAAELRRRPTITVGADADVIVERVRPTPTGSELDELYAHPNDASRWAEHRLRLDITRALARETFGDLAVVVDPAAGKSPLALDLAGREAVTGDLSPRAPVDRPGVDAITFLDELPPNYADLVLLGEILEHVDDPVELLAAACRAGRRLIVSTPLDEPAGVNPEHVWRWNRPGVEYLLGAAGWWPVAYAQLELDVAGYGRVRFQMHAAERQP